MSDEDGARNDRDDMNKAARELGRRGGLKGGKARAAKLSPEERSAIARRAVEIRWEKARRDDSEPTTPRATHTGELKIGSLAIPCAVLEDGTRVLTQEGFLGAIGRAKKAKGGQGASVDELPAFLAAKNLKPFISEELKESTKPVIFKPFKGPGYRGIAYGYRAELLPSVCRVYIDALRAGKLTNRQMGVAAQCEILLKGLENVAIVALVDEATGYQKIRVQNALAQILERFVAKELAKWVKTFPDEFYEQMFRLRGWAFSASSSSRPPLAGTYTNDLVYERLAPGVLDELKRITPRDQKGRLKHHYHRRLTEDVGHPRLREHLAAVIAFMRASDDWEQFYRLIDRAFPKFNTTPQLPMRYEDS